MKQNRLLKLSWPALILFVPFIFTMPLFAQQTQTTTPGINLTKGAVLTGFRAGWTSSARDSHNQEFEKGINSVSVDVDALYFITKNIAIGPELSYQYLYRDFEDPFETGEAASNDRWNWNITYGGQVGWFIPVEKLFGSSALGQSVFFAKGGVNWQRFRLRSEQSGKADPVIRIGYNLSTGFLIPLGRNIGLEASLQYEARRREYGIYEFTGNLEDRELIREDVKWPSTISLGIGLKIRL